MLVRWFSRNANRPLGTVPHLFRAKFAVQVLRKVTKVQLRH
jgi:hypothetical protein